MMRIEKYLPLILWFLLQSTLGQGQENIFILLKSEKRLANEYLKNGDYNNALNLYLNLAKKNSSDNGLLLKSARCHYFLKQYEPAVQIYDSVFQNTENISADDLFRCAESLAILKRYDHAIEYYKRYLEKVPDDQVVFNKLWRIKNLIYLFKDSSDYEINRLPLNTPSGELCPAFYRAGIVFMSNRKEVRLIQQMDATSNKPFYRLYFTNPSDSLSNPVVRFGRDMESKFHAGPVAFYDNFSKMVFSGSGIINANSGERTLRLYFAEEKDGEWIITAEYPFNSSDHSITDPTISNDGRLLFFASDMDGGIGGKDIYRSELIDGEWTKPENLGTPVNTPYDEVFPFLYSNHMLYFASNGHAGLGGLDIFKVVLGNNHGEVINPGYPLNTSQDDFGIIVSGNTGYLTSNRKNGRFDDNIYVFEIKKQVFPIEITGQIKYKERNVSSSELKLLPDAKIYLIDNVNDHVVAKCTADNTGGFSLTVPYFSKYKIKVTAKDIEESIVSFDIPKNDKLKDKFEIVVVKKHFDASLQKNEPKESK